MKTIITTNQGKMPEEEFKAAMVAMNYFIGQVDKRQRLPFRDMQYVEWIVEGIYDEGQWQAIGRPKYLHDNRYTDAARKVQEFTLAIYGNTPEVAVDQTHRIRFARILDAFYFYSDLPIKNLVGMIVKGINTFGRGGKYAVVFPRK